MNKIETILLITAFITISCDHEVSEQYNVTNTIGYPTIDLVQQEQLDSLLNNNSNIVVVDVRKIEDFLENHIPNAQQIWRPDIRNTDTTVEGLLASKTKIESLLGRLGADNESLIIAYDNKGNPDAARLWWILKYYGHDNVALLNGGITAYDSTKLTKSIFTPTPTNYTFNVPSTKSILATKDMVMNAINDSNYVILDNRSKEEYSGKELKGSAGASGRIPTSIYIDYSSNINYARNQVFHDIRLLETIFKEIPRDKNIITYCQSGVRSAHTLFVLTELLGYENVSNYDGSWLEWSNDTTLPLTQDSL